MTDPVSDNPRTALIFGGSRGIGAAIAKRLAAEKFSVALTYVSRPDKAREVCDAVSGAGGKAIAIHADSGDPAAIQRAVAEATDQLGLLDVAVINAGVLRLGSIESFNPDDLDLLLNVNIRGVFLAMQASTAAMRDGGRIITIGSNTAIRTGAAGGSAYAMTKAAVASLVKTAALDLAPRQITVNNLQPGPTETDMTAGMADWLKERIPLRRLNSPDDVASAVCFLASSSASLITGTSITIDGGYVL
ncbi:SDR family oxidoreductase [Bradyrhizobium embrapense]|uniref:SDR family oxidoreductase n=1 Tax=Bradyrhizobium embrapense TaxID=630921 RepID=UPI00067AB26A|nr:SDR family oxidoreductase [Bradyrhizobium embrapense]